MSADSHKTVSIAGYVKVLLVLLGLTVLTVVVAPPVTGVHFGIFNAFIAFAIATVKATLVGAVFMHLKYDDKFYALILGTSVFFLILLFLFSTLDWSTRVIQHSVL